MNGRQTKGHYFYAPNTLLTRMPVVFVCKYSISQEICTRFCCALLCCGMQSFIMNSHEVFIHIHQGCFAGTGAIVRLPQCQWSKPDGYGKISQCITTTKHSKAKTVCIFLGIYCITTWSMTYKCSKFSLLCVPANNPSETYNTIHVGNYNHMLIHEFVS